MKLWELVDKKVERVLNNGKVVTGIVSDWTDDYTSISGDQEITIDTRIYAESDYKSIKVLNEEQHLAAVSD